MACVVRSWRKSSCHSGVEWYDEGKNEDGFCCPDRSSVDAVCQLCALSTTCWRQTGLCAAFLPAQGPWMLILLKVPGFVPVGWLSASARVQEVFSGCRTCLWQWHCCVVRLLAELYKPAWSTVDGKERVSGWETSAAGDCLSPRLCLHSSA